MSVEVIPTGTVGAEVRGVDLARVTPAEVDAIKQAWYRHDVLVFRNQSLTDDELLSFSRHFGTLDPPPEPGRGAQVASRAIRTSTWCRTCSTSRASRSVRSATARRSGTPT